MFVPVHDINPLKRLTFQWGTVFLIALNILTYLLFATEFFPPVYEYAVDFALVPAEFLGYPRALPSEVFQFREPLPMLEGFTILTYMFLHFGFFHLAGNMLFLWVFGDNVEDAMGHLRFVLFYLICGVVAALTHLALLPASEIPVIGASGAVGGVVAAYLILHPRVKVWVLALYRIPLRITAAWAIGFWVAMQIYSAFFAVDEQVTWGAHLGGLAAGAVLILFMRRPDVPLFDRPAKEA